MTEHCLTAFFDVNNKRYWRAGETMSSWSVCITSRLEEMACKNRHWSLTFLECINSALSVTFQLFLTAFLQAEVPHTWKRWKRDRLAISKLLISRSILSGPPDFEIKGVTCILNQWLEFYQTSTDTSLGHGKEVIRFWWPWPHFQGHYIIKTLKMSFVCTLSHESIDGIWPNWQIHHCDGGKKWLAFGDLDLIFKVTPVLWNSNLIEKSLCAHYPLNQWLEFDQTSTDTSIG